MNNKKLKEKIKQAALSEMPDVLHKIDIKSIDIENEQEVKTSRLNIGFNKNLKLAFSAFILIITVFFSFQIFNINDSTYPLESDIEVLGFETVSSQALLEYSEIQDLDLSSVLSIDQSKATDTEEYLDDMTPMIELAELLVNNKENITYEETESDIDGYEKKIHFLAYNLSGDEISYDIYYTENNGHITGKITKDDVDYLFTKNNQVLRLYKNNIDYVEVINSKENEANAFSYRYVVNQSEHFKTQIKINVEDNQYRAEFNYENNRGIKISMMMRRENQGKMDIDYEILDQTKELRGRFDVEVKNNGMTGKMMYQFIFGDSSKSEREKRTGPPEDTPGNNPNHGPGRH